MSLLGRLFESREVKAARLATEAATKAVDQAKEQLYASGPDAGKVTAALALAHAPDGLAVLVKALSTEDVMIRPETRIAAAVGLAEVGLPAVPHLVSHLTHRWVEVQRHAARALADIADSGSFDALAALIPNQRVDADVREAAIVGLGNIGDERAVDMLVALGEDEKEQMSFLRRAAYTALACLGGARAIEATARAASSGDGYVKTAAAKALATLKEPLPGSTRRRVRMLPR